MVELSQGWECADRAVQTIGEYLVELCTGEREYRFTEAEALDAGNCAIAERCCLFLQTRLEYGWPEAPNTVLPAVAAGAAVFWVLPLGVVLLVAALVFRETALAGAGIACLGLSGLWLWWWHRREHMPDWKAYWASGEREAWPFLCRADCEHARRGVAQDRASTGSQSSRAETDPAASPATSR